MAADGPGVAKYPHIFSPAKVGAFHCRNRVKEKVGSEKPLPADTVALAIPRKARQQWLAQRELVCGELYVLGDGYLIGIRI